MQLEQTGTAEKRAGDVSVKVRNYIKYFCFRLHHAWGK